MEDKLQKEELISLTYEEKEKEIKKVLEKINKKTI
jgi:hypothetical protein